MKIKKSKIRFMLLLHYMLKNISFFTIDFFTNEKEWYLLDANVSKQRGGLGTYILNNIKGLSQRHASAIAAIMESEG